MFKLEPHEKQSAVWKKISGHLEERIDTLRKKNDGQLDMGQTAGIRGQISAYKSLLVVGEPEK